MAAAILSAAFGNLVVAAALATYGRASVPAAASPREPRSTERLVILVMSSLPPIKPRARHYRPATRPAQMPAPEKIRRKAATAASVRDS